MYWIKFDLSIKLASSFSRFIWRITKINFYNSSKVISASTHSNVILLSTLFQVIVQTCLTFISQLRERSRGSAVDLAKIRIASGQKAAKRQILVVEIQVLRSQNELLIQYKFVSSMLIFRQACIVSCLQLQIFPIYQHSN